MASQLTVTTPSDLEIVITRLLDAPRYLVFEAHTSCEHIVHWWAPDTHEMTDCAVHFKPGGVWRMAQRGTDGVEHGFHGEFREIVRPERIVWTFDGHHGGASVETVTFEEQEGKTLVTAVATFESVEERNSMLRSGMGAGVAESYDRLESYAASLV